MAIIFYNKKYTETLATMLERFRRENPQYMDSKITYAGRLDPMAEGLMILLTDDHVHKKEEYLGKDKIYEVDFFFGAETDSLDILGMVKNFIKVKEISEDILKLKVAVLKDIKLQEYPHYSSRTVSGKPLWQWAREGKLEDITIPTREVEIFKADYLGLENIPVSRLQEDIIRDISSIKGDFRQSQIIKSWEDFWENYKGKNVNIFSLRLHVSSGTYVRSLVREIGRLMNIPTTTLRIKRIQIGDDILT